MSIKQRLQRLEQRAADLPPRAAFTNEQRAERINDIFSKARRRWGDDWRKWQGPARRLAELLEIARQRRAEKGQA